MTHFQTTSVKHLPLQLKQWQHSVPLLWQHYWSCHWKMTITACRCKGERFFSGLCRYHQRWNLSYAVASLLADKAIPELSVSYSGTCCSVTSSSEKKCMLYLECQSFCSLFYFSVDFPDVSQNTCFACHTLYFASNSIAFSMLLL